MKQFLKKINVLVIGHRFLGTAFAYGYMSRVQMCFLHCSMLVNYFNNLSLALVLNSVQPVQVELGQERQIVDFRTTCGPRCPVTEVRLYQKEPH